MNMLWRDRDVTATEDVAIGAFMARLAAMPADGRQLPDANVLWWKAQLLRRWDAERHAQAPLDVMAPIQLAASLVVAGVLLIWSLPSVIRALSFPF